MLDKATRGPATIDGQEARTTMRPRGDGSIERRGNSWRIIYYQDGREVRVSVAKAIGKRPGDVTEQDALRLLRARLHAVETHTAARPHAERVTVTEIVEQYAGDVELRRGPASAARVRRNFARIKPVVGSMRAVRLDNPTVEAWARQALKEYSEQTVDHTVATLVASYRLAVRARVLPRVPYLLRLRPDNARRDFFEPDEFRALLPHLPAPYDDLARFAYLTGCRQGEILGFRWADIDRRARMAKLAASATKTREPRTIPLDYRDARTQVWADGELWQLIEKRSRLRVVGNTLCPYVFHKAGRPIVNFQGYVWRGALKAATLPPKTFHSLRRTFARDAVRAGVPETVVMARTGHKTRSMLDRYNITSTRDLERSQAALEAHRGASPPSTPPRALGESSGRG